MQPLGKLNGMQSQTNVKNAIKWVNQRENGRVAQSCRPSAPCLFFFKAMVSVITYSQHSFRAWTWRTSAGKRKREGNRENAVLNKSASKGEKPRRKVM